VERAVSTGWLIALGLVVAYIAFVVWLVQTGRLAKWNLSLMLGFALMVRTQRGKGLIDAIARPKRFWNFIGDFGTVLSLVGMVLMTVLFMLTLAISLDPGSGVQPLGASEILVIPGVNPFVPLWYGLIALALTLVVHEGGHGVLARANGMRVKSLGLLVAVVPIGAFVEPDEDDLKASSRRQRLRVFAAGPAVNIGTAALCLAAFALLMGTASPEPGVHVALTVKDAPADEAGIEPGHSIVSVDGAAVADWEAFTSVMETRRPGDVLDVGLDDGQSLDVALSSYWDELTPAEQEAVLDEQPAAMAMCYARLEPDPDSGAQCAERLQGQAFLGVRPLLPGDTAFASDPFSDGGRGLLTLVSLPIGEVRGQPFLSVYLPEFHEAPFAPAVFWALVSLLFWVFWINLMVGLTNILPMLPLDGGHIFRDAVGGLVEKLRPAMDPEARDRLVGRTAGLVSFLILGAFILQIIGPRLVAGLG
jgi:membrane-associated protease RseP (regulator of RpoE activity)